MLFGLYIAKKLGRSKQRTFTRTVIKLAALAVSISVTVVILSYGILLGFKQEIRNKVSGYAGHITIRNYDLSKGNETSYLTINDSFIRTIESVHNVSSVFPFLNKAGILKSDSVIEGLIFRGVPHSYNFDFYEQHLSKGRIPRYSDTVDSYEILISEYTATMLDVDTGDLLHLYFIDQSDVKRRRPKVVGIYNTGLLEFDKQFAIADIRVLQRVVSQGYYFAGGYEVRLHSFDDIDRSADLLDSKIGYQYAAISVKDQYFTIFQWLKIVDTNVLVIIILMFTVAIINIITVLLILIIERIPMIGIFKAMGARTVNIMRIFSWQGLFILFAGLIVGNILSLGFGYLQNRYHFIGLEPETYYMDAVPFYIPIYDLLLINVGAIVLSYLFTMLPAAIVSRVRPAQSIRFK